MGDNCIVCHCQIFANESWIGINKIYYHMMCLIELIHLCKNKNCPVEIIEKIFPDLEDMFRALQRYNTPLIITNRTGTQLCAKCGAFPWKICMKCREKICSRCWNPFCTGKNTSYCYVCGKNIRTAFKCISCGKNICKLHRVSGCSLISTCSQCTIKVSCEYSKKCHRYDHMICKDCGNYGNSTNMFCENRGYFHFTCSSPKVNLILSLISNLII